MQLKNHIAYRFLTDSTFIMETIESIIPDKYKALYDAGEVPEEIVKLYALLDFKYLNPKTYVVTESVIEKLDMLKVKRKQFEGIGEQYDWSVFQSLPECKKTFIMPNSKNGQQWVLRMWVTNETIAFCHLVFNFDKGSNNHGKQNTVMYYVNRKTGEQCDHFNHLDVKSVEEIVYKLLCFIFLSENDEIEVKGNSRYGTRKSGKIINDLPFPVTVITSKWNITSIRTEKFGVRGHFAIRWSGEGRTVAKVVFIEPFEKNGYVRKAKNQELYA